MLVTIGCGRKPAFSEEEMGKAKPVLGGVDDSGSNAIPDPNSPNVASQGSPTDVLPQFPNGDEGEPVLPSDPSNPNDPSHPVDPVDPIDPADPTDPVNPDNPTDPDIVVPPNGNEIDPSLLEDVVMELDQAPVGKVDILWLVDGSGSMSEEQQYLGSNFSAFINQLTQVDADFQLAVTSLDACHDQIPSDKAQRICPAEYGGSPSTHLRGSFRGVSGRKVLKRGDPDLATKFQSYTSVGTENSGFEHGMKSAQMAVEKVLSGENESLLRSGSFLTVIIVSDEEDDGIGLGMNDAYSNHNYVQEGYTTFRYSDSDLINYLNSVKGQGNFSISAITGTRDPNSGHMCTSPHSNPLEEGTQYISAANKTGGVIQSICETNWDHALTEMGVDMQSQITQITLTDRPAATSFLRVYINGVETTHFQYISGNNSVKFDPGFVPVPGAHIKITFMKYIN